MLAALVSYLTIGLIGEALPTALDGVLKPGQTVEIAIPAAPIARSIAIVVAMDDPSQIDPAALISTTVRIGTAELRKTLHIGDPDVAWLVHQPKQAEAIDRVTLTADKSQTNSLVYTIEIADLGEPALDGVAFESEPNDRFQEANPIILGQPIYGLADDRPYFPLGDKPTEREQTIGQDWFTFEFVSETPKLAFFGLDFIDRDVPPDVRVYRVSDGKLVEYTQGIDPQSLQRERPPRMGANKFTTRILTKGRYYVLVDACQPEYQLRTKLFDVPPYLNKEQIDRASGDEIEAAAKKAIRSAMDFQLLAGDSWLANTPRKGHPLDRIANPHHETSTCIACHPTHFTTQSALAAVRSGYKVEQPAALSFLTDRLANNPVPFHGYPDALWARVIPAPANVMGRLSTILIDFENLVSHAPRDNTHRGIGEFLKLYYDGRSTIPPDESNGNNPVSRYKVATDSWRQLDELQRRARDDRYAQTRDLIAKLIKDGKPANTRDLAAQTIGLCLIDKQKNADLIASNVKQLLELQHPDGQWPIKFDSGAPGAQMQTGESLYALTLAGMTKDDSPVHKGVLALLGEQKPFGGWLDLGPYEQFQTPFRETQWALIALSSLYPGPGTKGWDGPLGIEPKLLKLESSVRLIADLDRIWDQPEPSVLAQVVDALGDPNPLVRYSACRALARVGASATALPLAGLLSDHSKIVQRAAAEAIRSIANRASANHSPGETEDQRTIIKVIKDSLRSPNVRARRGATRIFGAHFRDLSQEQSLLGLLIARLDDADVIVQLQATKGLWRWWYWRAEPQARNPIEDALIAKLAVPTHSWVRRNLIEALYIIGDENIRYLYQNWIPSLPTQVQRDRATTAQHATVNRIGGKYVEALSQGNALQREGVLRAISEFHERPVLGGRIGNDLEPILFYDNMLVKMCDTLMKQLSDADPMIRRLALQAIVSLRGDREPSLARALLARFADPDDKVREWAATMSKEFPLKVDRGKADPDLLALVETLLSSPIDQAQSSGLALIGRIGARNDPAADPAGTDAIASRLRAPSPVVRAAALRVVPTFPSLLDQPETKQVIAAGLTDADPEVRIAGLSLALDHPGLATDSALRKALEDQTQEHRLKLLNLINGKATYRKDLRLVGVVSNALIEENQGVREKALQLLQSHPELVANPAVAQSLRELTSSTSPRQKELAATLLATRGRSSSARGNAEELDIAFFEAKVLPIFSKLGEDGQNCVGCHRSHTILKLALPDKSGQWSPGAVRTNFRSALRVVDLSDPSRSLLLGKPTWEAAEEAEAQKDPTKQAHAGGVRFETKTSREYQLILDWINGARLKPDAKPGE